MNLFYILAAIINCDEQELTHPLHSQNSMGHAVSDINNDGHMDVFLSTMYYSNKSCNLSARAAVGNSLYQYKSKRNFTEIADKVSMCLLIMTAVQIGQSITSFDTTSYIPSLLYPVKGT